MIGNAARAKGLGPSCRAPVQFVAWGGGKAEEEGGFRLETGNQVDLVSSFDGRYAAAVASSMSSWGIE